MEDATPSDVGRLSVIICTWNRATQLDQTLRSISAADAPHACEVEVIVVDNNSCDNTLDVVKRWQTAWQTGTLSYVFESRQGKQFALNAGVQKATGQALAFTDDDVIVSRDWILSIVRALGESGAGVIGGVTHIVWPDARPSWYNSHMCAVTGEYNNGPNPLEPAPNTYVPAGANMVVRRLTFDRIGTFSPDLYRHMDYEFGTRAHTNQIAVRYDPSIVVSTTVPKAAATTRYFRRWYFKMGIALALKAPDDTPQMLHAPRWLWRQLMTESFCAAVHAATGHPSAFDRQLSAIKFLGFVSCRWRRRWQPATLDAWVRRWSQKQDGDFT